MKVSEIRGTGVAIITPFKKDGNIDFTALEKVINHVITGGVQNIVSLGTTGETPTLSIEEKKEIIHFTIEKVGERVPVIVGVGGNNTQEIVKQLQTLPLERATAILSACPAYNKPSSEGLYQHYKALAKVSPKPIVLYNVPGRSAKTIPVDVIVRLAEDFDNIVGVKDATGDLSFAMELIHRKPKDFTVVSGDDLLALSQVSIGMEGVISVAANCYPKEMSQLIEWAQSQNFVEARKIQYELLPAFKYMFEENNPAGVKSFLAAAGYIEEELRLPLVPVNASLKEKITQFVKKKSTLPVAE